MTLAMEEIAAPGLVWHGRGKDWPLKPIDGYGLQLIKSFTPDDQLAMLQVSGKIVARGLGIPFDEVFGTEDKPGFSVEEVTEVMELMQLAVRRVEAAAPPNSEAAAERTENNLSLAG